MNIVTRKINNPKQIEIARQRKREGEREKGEIEKKRGLEQAGDGKYQRRTTTQT